MIHLLLFGRQVYLKYSADEMSVYAAQASFFIIMAAFPFFMVLLALIQVAPIIHEADLLRFLLPAIPDRFRGLLIYLLDSLRSDSPAALISVTALAAIWSASKGMLGIEKGLNRVFGVTSPRNYILRRALCSVYTLCFSLMCVASLALLVFGSFLQGMLLKWIPALAYLSGTISLCRGLVMFFMLTIFFIALYTALPHRRLSIPGQIPGAMFSAAGWALTSLAFSVYFKETVMHVFIASAGVFVTCMFPIHQFLYLFSTSHGLFSIPLRHTQNLSLPKTSSGKCSNRTGCSLPS